MDSQKTGSYHKQTPGKKYTKLVLSTMSKHSGGHPGTYPRMNQAWPVPRSEHPTKQTDAHLFVLEHKNKTKKQTHKHTWEEENALKKFFENVKYKRRKLSLSSNSSWLENVHNTEECPEVILQYIRKTHAGGMDQSISANNVFLNQPNQKGRSSKLKKSCVKKTKKQTPNNIC